MLKRILIPLDSSPYTETAVKLGTAIAKMTGAELTGMVVLDIPGIEKSIGPVPLGGMYYAEKLSKAREKKALDYIHSLLDTFRTRCEEEGVTHFEAEQQGSPSERILKESIFYDAVIMGLKTFYHFEAGDKPGDSLDKILAETITPVYGVPASFEIPKVPEEKIKALIAFDGSIPASRALQRFAQLAVSDLFEVKLVISHDDKEVADYFLTQAEAYLKSHSISIVHKEQTSDSIIHALESRYLEWADIVVAGAHSKKGLFDFLVGSLTRYLIKEDKKPVLIGQ